MSRHRRLAPSLTWGLALGSLALTAALFSRLPTQVPSHFGLDGRPDGFLPRPLGAWLLPAFALVPCAALWPGWGRSLERVGVTARTAPWVAVPLVLLLVGLQLQVLSAALRPQAHRGVGLVVTVALLNGVLAQALPRVRRNRWVGYRTPWTLDSDEVWERTHRFASRFITFTTPLVVALAFASTVLASVLLVASLLVPGAYSYRVAREVRGTPPGPLDAPPGRRPG